MRDRLTRLMDRHGQSLTLVRRATGRETGLRAFLQPLLKEREDLPVRATPLGAVSRQRWLYIGPPEPALEPGDELILEGRRLAVQEALTVFLRREPLYRRAILRRKKEDAS